MLHGAGHCAQVWNLAARALATTFHVMAFDQRGHGDSGAPGKDYTFHQLALDLIGIIRQMQLDEVAVVGHSSGGLAALIADSLEPGLIARGVLVEAVIQRSEIDPGRRLAKVASSTRRKRIIWESRDAMLEAYQTRSAYQAWNKDVLRDFIEGSTRLLADGRAEVKCDPEVEALFYEDRESLDIIPYLPYVKGQYLLLLGNYSGPQAQSPDPEGVRHFLRSLKGATVKQMGVGTHFLPMEYPDLVIPEIQSYLLKNHGG